MQARIGGLTKKKGPAPAREIPCRANWNRGFRQVVLRSLQSN